MTVISVSGFQAGRGERRALEQLLNVTSQMAHGFGAGGRIAARLHKDERALHHGHHMPREAQRIQLAADPARCASG